MMAEIAYTSTDLGDNRLIEWAGAVALDTFQPINLSQYDYSEAVIQVGGTFDTNTVTVQGSNDNAVYADLDDPHGSPISITAAAVEGLAIKPAYIKPVNTGGTTIDITVKLFLRR